MTELWFCGRCHVVIADPNLDDDSGYDSGKILWCQVCDTWREAVRVVIEPKSSMGGQDD